MYFGVDAYAGGWLVVGVGDDESDFVVDVHNSFNEFLNEYEPRRVLVDIPIGLPEEGRRECDVRAKELLGCRGNSVFYAPNDDIVREFGEDEYGMANEESKGRHGHGVSKQAWNIVPKIRDVRDADFSETLVHETHPELCFCGFNDSPLAYSKTYDRGEAQRFSILGEIHERHEEIVADCAETGADIDDALDALVAALTARLDKEETQTVPARAGSRPCILCPEIPPVGEL